MRCGGAGAATAVRGPRYPGGALPNMPWASEWQTSSAASAIAGAIVANLALFGPVRRPLSWPKRLSVTVVVVAEGSDADPPRVCQ